jgi:PAS domain S-box-containing protein
MNQKKQLEEIQELKNRLSSLEKRYAAFLNSSDDGIWYFDSQQAIPIDLPEDRLIQEIYKNGILTECNDAFARMYGYENRLSIINTQLDTFLDPADPINIEYLKKFIRSGFHLVDSLVSKKGPAGEDTVFRNNLFGIIEDNCLVHAWGSQRDITEQMEAQAQIISSEERYRNIFEYASDALFIENFDGEILSVNQKACEMLGYSRDQLLSMNIQDLIPEENQRQLSELITQLKKDKLAITRSKNRRKDGSLIDVEVYTKLFYENDAELIQVFVRDISQQVRDQERIQALSAQIEQFSRISADIITFKDTPPFRDILGHVGVTKKVLAQLEKADSPREKYWEYYEKGIKLGNQSCYIPHTMKHIVDQQVVDFGKMDYSPESNGWHREDNLLVAMKDKSGEFIGIISLDDSKSGQKPTDDTIKPLEIFANHISQILHLKKLEEEQRQIAEKFQQSEKLRALGEMAGGVAHDFNNVLSAILGRAQLLKRNNISSETLQGLEVIEKAAMDGAATIKRIQDFTRLRTDRKFTPININDTVRDSINYTRTRWKDDAEAAGIRFEIITNFEQEPLVKANASEMREVFTNLILNSIEAMPDGGKIEIHTIIEKNTVVITITDNGCGMDQQTVKRIFDPFYTTKGVRGTGLGLSVTWGIIHRHNGKIELTSEVGIGTTITITLPIYTEVETEAESVAQTPTNIAVKQPIRILVVDDEEDPRQLLNDIIKLSNHDVLMASTGKEALQIVEKNEDVKIIFSDLGMPEMSGWELSREIRAKRPDAIIVVITGWGTQLDTERLENAGIDRVIAKPFQVDQIDQLVRECILILQKQTTEMNG